MKFSIKAAWLVLILGLFLVVLSAPGAVSAGTGSQNSQPVETPVPESPYFSRDTITTGDGTNIEKDRIGGPPVPPPGYELERAAVTAPNRTLNTNILNVPAYDWVFGCSAVSAAMIAGYYDNNGFPNMYTGLANGGVAPFNSSYWPQWTDGWVIYPNNPLIASHQGVDGRAGRGSIDDYWVEYFSEALDPYLTGGWAQHAWGEAVGDFMKTSQSYYDNVDGSTSFFPSTGSEAPFTCSQMEIYTYYGRYVSTLDGTYGRKLFYQARGYTVTDCYNQLTDNQIAGGFSFNQYKAEIDAGRPVLLNLEGHSIVGVGYDSATNTVYIHDTWDYGNHSMTWGGSYSGMALRSVSIVNLVNPTPPPGSFGKANPGNGANLQPADLTLSWSASIGATSYEYCSDKTNNNACDNGWINAGTATSVGLTGLESGASYYWQVRAQNTTATTEADGGSWWRFDEEYRPPTITSFSPDKGSAGTSVTITGTNFNGATAVSFNGTPASFSVISSSTINTTVPSGATSGKITVTTPGGAATSSLDFTVLTPVFIQFSASTYIQAENGGTASIPVTLNPASSQTVTVNYNTGNGSAIAGEDYLAASGTLVFSPGVTTQTINIAVIDDSFDEPDSETVILSLSNPVNASITGSNPVPLFILDNDAPPETRFSTSQVWVNENYGAAVLNVTLNTVSRKTVYVSYTSSDGTAWSGSDYSPVYGTLTFNPGDTSHIITVPIIDDWQREAVETFSITLSNQANVTLGSPYSISVMVVDDDPIRLFIPLLRR